MSIVKSNRYNGDIKIFLISIPLISAFNYYLTYTKIQLDGFLVLTYTIDTIQGYIAWLSVRWTILKLDHIYPFSKNVTSRIVIQTVTTTAFGMIVIILLTELVSWIARGRGASLSFYTNDIFIIFIWFLVINAFYIVLYFYRQWKWSQEQNEDLIKAKMNYLLVKLGQRETKIPFDQIKMIYLEQGLTGILTESRTVKCFLTLDDLEDRLPKLDFFRLNRQLIINRSIIKEYTKLENGKIKASFSTETDLGSAIISRTRAPKFKRWLKLE